jgi:hypothetical protein
MIGRIALLTAIVLTGATPARADFAAGAAAYDAGDYTAAFREWEPLAQQGDTEAMVAVAELYRATNASTAFRWYRRAARAGNAVAGMNLAEMYLKGRGTETDRIAAYIWFTRAADLGKSWAREQRDKLGLRLTEAERAAAQAQLGSKSKKGAPWGRPSPIGNGGVRN